MKSALKHSKRGRLVLGVVLLLLVLMIVYVSLPRDPRYRSYARVRVAPFTNGVLSAAWLEQTSAGMNGVRLEQLSSTSVISISCDDSSTAGASNSVNAATRAFQTAVEQTYGASVQTIDRGELPVRPYSFFRDELGPDLKRLLKRVGIHI